MKSSLSPHGAIGFAIAGFTFWVLADSSIKGAGRSSLPGYEIIAFLGLFIAFFLLAHAALRNEVKALWPKRPKRQLVRSCLDLGNNLCVVVALRHLPLTMFYILVFTAPMFIALGAAVFLHEGLNRRKASAILAGFAGVVIAVNPFGAGRQGDGIGYAACAVCVTCFATNMVWARVMTQTERPDSLTFSSGVVMAVAGFGLMLWHAEPLTSRLLALLSLMGLLCTLGSICVFIAIRHTTAATVSQYHYTQLISGALVAYLVWHEKPTLSMLIGGLLILAAGLYIAVTASHESLIQAPCSEP